MTERSAASIASSNLENRILDCLALTCGTDEVRANPDLAVYERQVMDSMKTVEFILAIEEKFGLYVSPAELDRERWSTPRMIVTDIQKRLQS